MSLRVLNFLWQKSNQEKASCAAANCCDILSGKCGGFG
jgi:hypothetical protein